MKAKEGDCVELSCYVWLGYMWHYLGWNIMYNEVMSFSLERNIQPQIIYLSNYVIYNCMVWIWSVWQINILEFLLCWAKQVFDNTFFVQTDDGRDCHFRIDQFSLAHLKWIFFSWIGHMIATVLLVDISSLLRLLHKETAKQKQNKRNLLNWPDFSQFISKKETKQTEIMSNEKKNKAKKVPNNETKTKNRWIKFHITKLHTQRKWIMRNN